MAKTVGMIFAAGRGTRLAPFTDTAPKALAPVNGVPMLEHVVKRLLGAGITDIVVNVHHFADQIVDFLKERHNFGARISISDETYRLLDTGGGIAEASRLFGDAEAVLVHNVDILSDVDLVAMLESHYAERNDATLLVSGRLTSRYLCFDPEDRMTGWVNVKTHETLPPGFGWTDATASRRYAFGGIHVLSAKTIGALKEYGTERAFPIIPFYAAMCRRLTIRAYMASTPYGWHDIGTPEKLASANAAFNQLKL